MRHMTRALVLVMLTCGLAGEAVYGQTKGEGRTASVEQRPVRQSRLRLTFVLKETDERGKVLNVRQYEATIGAKPDGGRPRAEIRTGARVPVNTGNMTTYVDVGVNFDVNGIEWVSDDRIAMLVNAEISSIDPTAQADPGHPVIRQNKWSGDEQMSLGEQRQLFSSDDLTSKNRIEVGLTVKRVD